MRREGLGGDVWGGFAAMLVAAPSAVGFGITVGATLGAAYVGRGALAGLVGAFALGLVASVVGGTRHLISAPCGPAALLLAALSVELVGGGLAPDAVWLLLTLVSVLAAALQVIFGLLGGGRIIKYIPFPVVAGYLSSVGVLLFGKQLPDFLGLPKGVGTLAGLASPSAWSYPALLVGGVTVAMMLLAPRLTTRVPAVILGLLAGAAAYALLGVWQPAMRTMDGNPLVIGAVGGTASELGAAVTGRWGALGGLGWRVLGHTFVPACTLAVLLSIDTLKTCVVVDSLTRRRSDSNRVLRGQGLGNLASSVLGGLPGAGTMGATLVNLSSGGTTARAGVLEGVFALVTFVLFGGLLPGLPPLLGWLPRPALAGIIVVVSLRMIDRRSLQLLRHRQTWPDFLVVAAVVATAVASSPIAAAGVGLALATVLFTRDQIRGSVVRRKLPGNRVASKRQRQPREAAVLQERGAEATVCSLQGTLFFGTADQLLTLLEKDLETCRWLVLDLRRVQMVDYTAAHVLEQIEAQLAERGATLVYSSVPGVLPTGLDLRAYLRQLGLMQAGRNVLVFDSVDQAIEWVEDAILESAGLDGGDSHALRLAEVELFRELDDEALTRLAEVIEERELAEGARLFARGDPGDEIFIIRRGAVQILLPLGEGRFHHLATFSRGGLLGDMAFLDHGFRSADAVALEDTSLFALSRQRFDVLARRYPHMGSMLFARLARLLAVRLRQTDAQLQALAES
jgi:SulP family sulfate permease